MPDPRSLESIIKVLAKVKRFQILKHKEKENMTREEWNTLSKEQDGKDYVSEYVKWMYNKNNRLKCSECPRNDDLDRNRADRVYPCGQQNCWVDCHCR